MLRFLARPAFRSAALGLASLAVLVPVAPSGDAAAQANNKWLSGGSLHNWYSDAGTEKEEGFVAGQQYGLRWPGLFAFTDMQAAKGLWVGARNVRDTDGKTYAARVIHVGPRVTGSGEVVPTQFQLVGRVELSQVFVNGARSLPDAAMQLDRTDAALPAEHGILSDVNTLLGLTISRRVLQFAHESHDNYHVIEYTLVNTGNTDGDAEIELPGQTLQDVVMFTQWRWSVARETRYLVGNATGWGKHTMVDARGDGLGSVYGDNPADNFRAMFAWHGFFPDKTLSYNNIGGPILRESVPALNIAARDTLGRLGASQFVGAVVLHADTAPGNTADDATQPRTMKYFDSDESFLSNNEPFTESKMASEYAFMTNDATDRHAFRAAASTNPADLPRQTAMPADVRGMDGASTSGGKSAGMGFGPYTLAPGQSVRIVLAESAAGLSREANEAIGRAYKALAPATRDTDAGRITYLGQSKTKNEWVFTGRDSLFQTFRRALANYRSGYRLQAPPLPPSQFNVSSGGDRVQLRWDVYPGQAPDTWEVYRAVADFDEAYTRVASVPGSQRSFDDTTPTRGLNYFYYIQAVKGTTDGQGGVPAGRPLRSSRYLAQAYSPAQLLRPQGGPEGETALSAIRVVPNPFYLSSEGFPINSGGSSRSPRYDVADRIGFLNLPGQCRIDIYTELGEKIYTIDHTNGSGDEYWNGVTRFGQVVASGVYLAIVTVTEDVVGTDYLAGQTALLKFTVIR